MRTLVSFILLSVSFPLLSQETTYWLPHFTQKAGLWETDLTLLNGDSSSGILTLDVFDSNGNPAGTWDQTLRSGEAMSGNLQDLLPDLTAETGSIKITTAIEQFSGVLTFTFLPTGGRSSIPLTFVPSTHHTFPLMEQTNNWTSGFALVNPGQEDCGVRVTLFTHDGFQVEETLVVLGPGEKFVDMLSNLLSPIPKKGYLYLESESPILGLALNFSTGNQQIIAVEGFRDQVWPQSEEETLLDSMFTVNLELLDAHLEFNPSLNQVLGSAQLDFFLKKGQTHPMFHLPKATIERITMDGVELVEGLDWKSETPVTKAQKRIILQGDYNPWRRHTITVDYRYSPNTGYQYYTDVNDIIGTGNEEHWPTINFPSERLRHRITFSIQDPNPYTMIGCGNFSEVSEGSQWYLDTERPVASYTVFYFASPQTDYTLTQRTINGVVVRAMAPSSQTNMASQAFYILESWLPQLESDIGPFPMEHGLNLLLLNGGGGMEYFGATATSLSALSHEVFHMYYACSMIARTYRDSWWDEAITSWYERGAGATNPIADAYMGDMVSNREPYQPGFDTRAYNEGASMFEHIARSLGSREALIQFLSQVWQDYQFIPLTTQQLLQLLETKTGQDYFDEFDQWLYSSPNNKSELLPPNRQKIITNDLVGHNQ